MSGAGGHGVTVGLVDSGVFADHPHVGSCLTRSVTVVDGRDGRELVVDDLKGDVAGHGTACAGVIHQGAPSARVVISGDSSAAVCPMPLNQYGSGLSRIMATHRANSQVKNILFFSKWNSLIGFMMRRRY